LNPSWTHTILSCTDPTHCPDGHEDTLTLRVNEEKKFRDPEDAYLDVRRQEAERKEQGLPPRIQFLEESQPDEQP